MTTTERLKRIFENAREASAIVRDTSPNAGRLLDEIAELAMDRPAPDPEPPAVLQIGSLGALADAIDGHRD